MIDMHMNGNQWGRARRHARAKAGGLHVEGFVLALCAVLATCWAFHSFMQLQDDTLAGPHISHPLSAGHASSVQLSRAQRTMQQVRQELGHPAALAPAPPCPAQQRHQLLLLDNETHGLTEAELGFSRFRAHPREFAISRFPHEAALAVAPTFGVDPADLPVAVYVKPSFEFGRSYAIFEGYPTDTPADFLVFFQRVARVRLLLANDADREACFFAVAEDAPDTAEAEVLLKCLKWRGRMWVATSVLDRFVARDKGNGKLMGEHRALYSGVFGVSSPGTCSTQLDRGCVLKRDPFPADKPTLEQRAKAEANRIWQNAGRNPKVYMRPNFTEAGFAKASAPPAVMEALAGYWEVNSGSWVREPLGGDFIFLNLWDSPSLSLPVPTDTWNGVGTLGHRIFALMKPYLEAWSGVPLLRPTAMYGIRIYTNGSRLYNHLDLGDTHIISAIINVDQEVDEPWPLEIQDHERKWHSVTIGKGEMIMYEGSTCVHGRERPMQGRFMANLFVHFAPVQLPLPTPPDRLPNE